MKSTKEERITSFQEEVFVLFLERKWIPELMECYKIPQKKYMGYLLESTVRIKQQELAEVMAHFATNLCGTSHYWLRRYVLDHYNIIESVVMSYPLDILEKLVLEICEYSIGDSEERLKFISWEEWMKDSIEKEENDPLTIFKSNNIVLTSLNGTFNDRTFTMNMDESFSGKIVKNFSKEIESTYAEELKKSNRQIKYKKFLSHHLKKTKDSKFFIHYDISNESNSFSNENNIQINKHPYFLNITTNDEKIEKIFDYLLSLKNSCLLFYHPIEMENMILYDLNHKLGMVFAIKNDTITTYKLLSFSIKKNDKIITFSGNTFDPIHFSHFKFESLQKDTIRYSFWRSYDCEYNDGRASKQHYISNHGKCNDKTIKLFFEIMARLEFDLLQNESDDWSCSSEPSHSADTPDEDFFTEQTYYDSSDKSY